MVMSLLVPKWTLRKPVKRDGQTLVEGEALKCRMYTNTNFSFEDDRLNMTKGVVLVDSGN